MAIFTVVLGPIVSQAADYWGRKWFLVGLSFSGALGALVTALATSMNMLIAGCCLIGTAFGMQPLLHAVVSEVLPRAWRGWAQSIVMMSNALGLFGGLVIGGGLNRGGDPDGFRYFFYIGMAFFLATGIICIFAYRPPQRELQRLPFAEKVAKLDFVGYALLGSGLVLFCLGLSYSQNPYSWSDPHVSAPFAIGLALAIALCVYEYKFKTDGMFHHGLFKRNRNFAISLLCIFCEGIGFFAANQYFAYQVSSFSAPNLRRNSHAEIHSGQRLVLNGHTNRGTQLWNCLPDVYPRQLGSRSLLHQDKESALDHSLRLSHIHHLLRLHEYNQPTHEERSLGFPRSYGRWAEHDIDRTGCGWTALRAP